jgi:hypothetical protein
MDEQRKSRRFQLRLPFELVRAGAGDLTDTGETMNLSSAGVLFTSRVELEIGVPIEYFITLFHGGSGGTEEIRLHCVGKVVRRHTLAHPQTPANSPVATAATVERYEFVRPSR